MEDLYDLIIVGAGPAGIFTALELICKHYHGKILIIEKGKAVEKRVCPKNSFFSNFLNLFTVVNSFYFSICTKLQI